MSLVCLLVVSLAIFQSQSSRSTDDPDKGTKPQPRLRRPSILSQRTVEANSWWYTLLNNGSFMFDEGHGAQGGEFPRASGRSAVFAAGVWFGALKHGLFGQRDTVTVSQVEYTSEFMPGRILVSGVADQAYRGYSTGLDLSQNTPIENRTDDLEYLTRSPEDDLEFRLYLLDSSRSSSDYVNWPHYAPRLKTGSPFIVPGAVSQTYSIFNDLERGEHGPEYSPSLGWEAELESFVSDIATLSQAVLFKLSFTNKSNHTYRNAVVGIWSDLDIDQSFSDLANVDTVRDIGFAYSEDFGIGELPMAVGFDLLQGPIVHQGDIPDVIFNELAADSIHRRRLVFNQESGRLQMIDLPVDQVTLDLTSFLAYGSQGSCLTSDSCRYHYLMGFSRNGQPRPAGRFDPGSGLVIDDQKIVMGSGPFTLYPSQTNEIWFACVGGVGETHGLGRPGVPASHVRDPEPGSAVAALYQVDDAIQKFFSSGFAFAGPPVEPVLQAIPLSDRVILQWDNRSELTEDPFGVNLGISPSSGYNRSYISRDFQGYRVYKSLTALPTNYVPLAEFDRIDGIVSVNDTSFDGEVRYRIHIGSDNGIRHFYEDSNVVQGRTYYYALTAYDYQPMYYLFGKPTNIPRSLESPRFGTTNIKAVTPQTPPTGHLVDRSAFDFIQTFGWNEIMSNAPNVKTIRTTVINPYAVSTMSLVVSFFRLDENINGRILQGLEAGTLAYDFVDSATGERLAIDNYTDDFRTFYDGNGNEILDRLEDGTVDPVDSVIDDRYFSTAIRTVDDAGLVVGAPVEGYFPIVSGVLFEPGEPDAGFRDVFEVQNEHGPLPDPRSVLHQSNTANRWSVHGYTENAFDRLYSRTVVQALHAFDTTANLRDANPNGWDFELRFTEAGDIAFTRNSSTFSGTGTGNVRITVPFELWNIKGTLYRYNDSGDDEHLVGKVSERTPNPYRNIYTWEYDTIYTSARNEYNYLQHFAYTNLIFGVYTPSYDPNLLVAGACTEDEVGFGYVTLRASLGPTREDTVAFQHSSSEFLPAPGTVVRLESKKAFHEQDEFVVYLRGGYTLDKRATQRAIHQVKAVPNPYYGRAFEYQSGQMDKKLKFINLPGRCVIRIFTVAGDLVRTLYHHDNSNNDRVDPSPMDGDPDYGQPPGATTSIEVWDLRNRSGRFVASGMYVAVIEPLGELRNFGNATVKFAVFMDPY